MNGPSLWYEVGICITTGLIVCINEGYACGQFSDLNIFCLVLRGMLEDEEKVIADGRYRGGGDIWAILRSCLKMTLSATLRISQIDATKPVLNETDCVPGRTLIRA